MLLSRNYPPSKAFETIIARHYVFSAELPGDFEMVDRLLSETPFIRILVRGDWAGEVAAHEWEHPGDVLFFGANGTPMRVRVRGPFHVIGIALRPCGWRCLFEDPASEYADRLMRLDEIWSKEIGNDLAARCTADAKDEDVIAACEAAIEKRRLQFGGDGAPNEPIRIFESIARDNSIMPITEAAARCGVSERQLERLARAHFGHSPKVIMRRSRFLDMAAALRGLGDPSDGHLAALRFFDQSHLTREFRHFIGMSPAQFKQTPTPLLTAGLELRQERKNEAAS